MSRERKSLKISKAPQTYSEVFKKKVVKEYELRLFTKAELRRRYNISGNSYIRVG